jgi:hypothetical protein
LQNVSACNFNVLARFSDLRRLRRPVRPESAGDPPLGAAPRFLSDPAPRNVFPRNLGELRAMTDGQVDSFCDFYGIPRPPAGDGRADRVLAVEDFVCGF